MALFVRFLEPGRVETEFECDGCRKKERRQGAQADTSAPAGWTVITRGFIFHACTQPCERKIDHAAREMLRLMTE